MPENSFEENQLLDGRYRIIRTIGEGGFGITYEAVNVHNSLRTAVKACKSEADKARFLREARILRDFADDPSVVTVLDSFEDNDTAFIVMEYLDGVTLSEEIAKNGKWPAEKAVRSLVPVMKALEKMHASDVIHRDISPDNLMYMPDGSIILMDFGAALQTEKTEFTRTAIFKSVYSPPEQRDDILRIGSWSDVYALCATIWFLITGTEPEDSLSRLLYDELLKPSEAGADILPAAETALMKGLALNREDRTPDISILRTELEKVYPDLSEEEKKEIEKRRKRRKRILAGCVCAAAAVAALLLYTFRINIWFSFIDTETIALDGREMTENEFSSGSEIVKERLKTYADGDRYLFSENDQQIFFEIPAADIPDTGDVSLNDVILSSVTRPMVLSVFQISEDEENSYEDLGVFSQTEDIAGFEADGDDALIFFSETGAEKMKGLLDTEGTAFQFRFDEGSGFMKKLSYAGTALGDGKTVRTGRTAALSDADYHYSLILTWGNFEVPSSLMKMHFTNAPSEQYFDVNSKWLAQWENTNETMFPGNNQKNENDIPGTTVSVRYSLGSTDFEHKGYNPSLFSFQAVLKNRLDSLDVPYSVGIDRQNENTYIVKLPRDRVWAEELTYMGEGVSLSLGSSLTSSSSQCVDSWDGSTGIRTEQYEDGTFSLVLTFDEDMVREVADIISTASEQGNGDLYLYFEDQYQIARCDAETALADLTKSGTIIFDRFAFAACPEMNGDSIHFADWMLTAFGEMPQDYGTMQTKDVLDDEMDAEIKDPDGNPVWFDNEDLLPAKLFETPESLAALELTNEWNERYSDTMEFEYDTTTRKLYADLYGLDSFVTFRQLLEDSEGENKAMYFSEISIRLYQQDRQSADPMDYMNISYTQSFEEGRLVQSMLTPGLRNKNHETTGLQKTLEQYDTLSL